jgi:thiamine biosynthesis lipoprotein
MRKLFIFISLVAAMFFSCSKPAAKIHFEGEAQGTYYSITYFDQQSRNFQQSIDSLLDAFNLSVSLWDDSSIISRINRNEHNVRTDTVFRDIFRISNQISEHSDGAFDVTVGKLVAAWGFHKKQGKVPDSALITELQRHIGYKTIQLESDKLIKLDTATGIDFNAIAQGYSVDMVGAFLSSKGIKNFLIDIGGEVLGNGNKADGTPWKVGIEKPTENANSDRELEATLPLADGAIATSGNYRKYYEVNGIRYSHTIDPATGYPVRHNLLSATVLAKTAAIADAWATAFMVMGHHKALHLINQHPEYNLQACFIVAEPNGKHAIVMTEGLKSLITKLQTTP